jgi:ATP-dependent exoDNAse (exonuclease V) alpha subunit
MIGIVVTHSEAGTNVNPLFHKDFAGLNEGQQIIALAAFNLKQNMLITGGGGVGKSHLIRFLSHIIPNLVLSASTGVAGVNIEGTTLDTFMGFNQHVKTVEDAANVKSDVIARLRATTVLLIDEASMVRADKLDMVDARFKAVFGNDLPFGGVKIILVGDFLQLPPVVANGRETQQFIAEYQARLFAFEANCYQSAGFVPYLLNEYVRQGDIVTRKAMRLMRMGMDLDNVVKFLNAKAKGVVTQNSLRICKTNSRVKDINEKAFAALKSKAFVCNGVLESDFKVNACPTDPQLYLKQGCRVLLTANNPEAGFLNGDLGELTGFINKKNEMPYLVVKLDRGHTVRVEPHEWQNYQYAPEGGEMSKKPIGTFTQFPVRLGYAITGHKSQGMTLDSAVVDLSGKFNADGLAYVVISRVRALENLKLTSPIKVSDICTSHVARRFTEEVSTEALRRRDADIATLFPDDFERAQAA